MKNRIFTTFFLIAISLRVFCQDFNPAIQKATLLINDHMRQTDLPGAQIAVLIDGKLIWSQGFGYSDLTTNEKVSTKTVFRIASLSKPVTSVALAKLIEEGSITPDADIRELVPEFPDKGFPITVRQLASSIAGIRHYTNADPVVNTEYFENVVQSLDKFKSDPLLFEPGTDFHYSSYGWVLLSAAMQKAANKSFFEIMETTWNDLGMNSTYFDHPKKIIQGTTNYYTLDKKGNRVEVPFEDRSFMYAGGGYLSTAEDLVRLGNALLEKEYINSSTIEEIITPVELPNGENTHYAMGWEVGQSRVNTPVIFHSGSMPSARSHLVLYPDENLVFAYLSNSGQGVFFNEREAHALAELFLEQKRKNNGVSAPEGIVGRWDVETTSLRGKKSKGQLVLKEGDSGVVSGVFEFRRSRKKKQFPILLAGYKEGYYHLMAMTPMLLDLYIEIARNGDLKGKWLHDMDVIGDGETDSYFDERKIRGSLISR